MSGRFLMTYYMVGAGLREFRRNGAIRDILGGDLHE